ncbi:MAG: hypothetical protein BJ554DRAFT_1859 [Olpidium bornovanus]|uniref:Uncharacterized protein n=1 Tax=Olpidium bornovanus TaxID=278681 RepID=A0A8H7ZRC0_9FUNG|nr:MAG: hypothetical protein BJ554DRAFT_1859 [Olpidium bornovanus]
MRTIQGDSVETLITDPRVLLVPKNDLGHAPASPGLVEAEDDFPEGANLSRKEFLHLWQIDEERCVEKTPEFPSRPRRRQRVPSRAMSGDPGCPQAVMAVNEIRVLQAEDHETGAVAKEGSPPATSTPISPRSAEFLDCTARKARGADFDRDVATGSTSRGAAPRRGPAMREPVSRRPSGGGAVSARNSGRVGGRYVRCARQKELRLQRIRPKTMTSSRRDGIGHGMVAARGAAGFTGSAAAVAAASQDKRGTARVSTVVATDASAAASFGVVGGNHVVEGKVQVRSSGSGLHGSHVTGHVVRPKMSNLARVRSSRRISGRQRTRGPGEETSGASSSCR